MLFSQSLYFCVVFQTQLDNFLVSQSAFPRQLLASAFHNPQTKILKPSRMWDKSAVIFRFNLAVFGCSFCDPDFCPHKTFRGEFKTNGFSLVVTVRDDCHRSHLLCSSAYAANGCTV